MPLGARKLTDASNRLEILKGLAVSGSSGAVVTQHKKASQVGADVLRANGNAVDAAVAIAFALGVLEPWMSGMGGGGYMLVGQSKEAPMLVDFNMRSPIHANPSDYPIVEGVSNDLFPWCCVEDERNTRGPLSICAPTMVAGLELVWKKYGSLPWKTLLEPAIQFANEGLPVDWYTQLVLSSVVKDLRRNPATKAMFLDNEGDTVTAGWTSLSQPSIETKALAGTLSAIADEGGSVFVSGEVGQALVEDIREAGGNLTLRDLELAVPRIVEPANISYRDNKIWSTSGLSGGTTLLEIFKNLEKYSMKMEPPDEYYSTLVKTILPALTDRLENLGGISEVANKEGCTTHFCVTDQNGLTVSSTITLVTLFGSKVISPQTGILLNSGMAWFDPLPNQANSIEPGKLCLNNMAPTLAQQPDGSQIAIGAAGGRKILPAIAQILSFMLDNGMSLQDACFHPRLDVQFDNTIVADSRIDGETLSLLGNLGNVHTVEKNLFPYHFGITGGLVNSNGTVEAMPDPMAPSATAICT